MRRLLCLLLLAVPAGAATVRVELARVSRVKLAGPVRIVPADGPPLVVDQVVVGVEGKKLRSSGGTVWPSGTRFEPFQAEALSVGLAATRHYRGAIVLHAAGGALSVVNQVDLEAYVQGVVPYEMDPEAKPAALAAQAVAARGFAVFRQRQAKAGAACDFTVAATQAYRGRDGETPACNAAAAATSGRVVVHGGRLVESVYSDCCGGIVASAEEAWNSPEEGLVARWDRAVDGLPRLDEAALGTWLSRKDNGLCQANPLFRWSRVVPLRDVLAGVAAWLRGRGLTGSVGQPRSLAVTRRFAGGRVAELRITGERAAYTVRGDAMRWIYGEAISLPSSLTRLALAGETMTFQGAGNGHGVGLCQSGAMALAEAGQSAAQIIAHYYDGATVAEPPAR